MLYKGILICNCITFYILLCAISDNGFKLKVRLKAEIKNRRVKTTEYTTQMTPMHYRNIPIYYVEQYLIERTVGCKRRYAAKCR